MSEIRGIIERQYKAAEVAVKEAIDHFVAMFDLLDDEYMKERAVDIKDVGNRLLKHLLGAPEVTLPSDTQPYILVAKELSPTAGAFESGICAGYRDDDGRQNLAFLHHGPCARHSAGGRPGEQDPDSYPDRGHAGARWGDRGGHDSSR